MNRTELEEYIAHCLGHNSRYDVELDNDEVELWINNDEALYNDALSEGVDPDTM